MLHENIATFTFKSGVQKLTDSLFAFLKKQNNFEYIDDPVMDMQFDENQVKIAYGENLSLDFNHAISTIPAYSNFNYFT